MCIRDSPNPFLRTSAQHTVAVIPARYDSSRLPGKVLADIAGRPMVEHVYRRAAAANGVDAVVAATDRVAETARDLRCDIVVNVQADLPLIEPEMIAEVVAPFADDATVQMSTLRQAISDPEEEDNPNVVKVVVDRLGNALYFSRSKIPYCRAD